MQDETDKSLGVALSAAVHLKKDERFDGVVPVVPVITGVMREEPRYIAVTLVDSKGDDIYVMPLTKEMAKEMADQFYDYIKCLEEEKQP